MHGKEPAMAKKVLAIDDEMDTLTFYAEVLEDYNYTPITAENGLEGIKKAREEKPDLILLDIMMPKKDGTKTYKELKNDPDLKQIPVLIITGISKEVDYKTLLNRQSTGHVPPEGHLTKPLSAEMLIAEINRILG
jgi:CheY-like chemotaxis protein